MFILVIVVGYFYEEVVEICECLVGIIKSWINCVCVKLFVLCIELELLVLEIVFKCIYGLIDIFGCVEELIKCVV